MSQMSGRHCPTCGISISADQRFCTNCGTVLEAQPQPPSQYGAQPPSQSYPYPQQTPPYAQQQLPSYAQSPQQQVPPYMQQAPQQQSPIAEAFGALGLLFLLRGRRFSGYRPQRQRSSCCGCLVLAVVLFLCLGVPSLYYARTSIPSISKGLNFSSGYNNNSSSAITTQPPITTAQINQAVNFFGVDITIVNAQQSKAFLDDSSAGTTGVVRLNLKEDNKGTATARFLYDDEARLILPDKTSVPPANEKQFGGPDGGVSRTNWLDFPVPESVQISQLTLQLGSDRKAQESIPLTGKASLVQYEPKTAQLSVVTQYAGLNWTITSATLSLGFKGQQADKGMQYVNVSLKVDNPTSQTFRGYWGDYIRLKSGDATQAPASDTTLPLSFDAGSSGTTGDVLFTMPSGSTSFTLILLANTYAQYAQATANFQVG
ncbi:MAG TPA: zinc-ribbon domain-containing protein [Ktedonobacteraceae bacterium]